MAPTRAALRRRATPEYRCATRVLFVAGPTTFAAMRCTQALLPAVSDAFGQSVTVAGNVVLVLIGMGRYTAGFFGAQSVFSGWTGALTTGDRADASLVYLFAYCLGSTGLDFAAAGCNGVPVFVAVGFVVAMGLVGLLMRRGRQVPE